MNGKANVVNPASLFKSEKLVLCEKMYCPGVFVVNSVPLFEEVKIVAPLPLPSTMSL